MSEQPEPSTRETAPSPGGADSIDDPTLGDAAGPPTTPDLPPGDVPGDEELPDELKDDSEGDQDPERTSGEGPVPNEPPA